MARELPDWCRYYSTSRKVRLVSTHVGRDSIGFLYRLAQLLAVVVVLIYTIVYSIIFKEAYKEFDTITSDVRCRLVGALRTQFTESELNNVDRADLPFYNRFWDLTKNDDFAPEMENSFFVPTNLYVTTNQKRGTCPDSSQVCLTNRDCIPKNTLWSDNDQGVKTGNCISVPGKNKSCEVTGWCPLETGDTIPSSTKAILEDTRNFQLHISNHVQFTQFNLDSGHRANFFVGNVVDEAIKRHNNCKRCNSYSAWVSDIVDGYMGTTPRPKKLSSKSKITYHDLAMKGAVINVKIHWSCYMGLRGSSQTYFRKHCEPTFTFHLMPSRQNFKDLKRIGRFVHKSDHDGRRNTRRDLYKTYGLWFRFHVTSDVSRFNLINTLKVLAVGLGMLKVFHLVFDFLAPKLCCNKKLESEEFLQARYIDIEDRKETGQELT